MYKTVLFFYSCCFAFFAPAQNLLLNGDFEEYWECPTGGSQMNKCKYVFNPCAISTSDYLHYCNYQLFHLVARNSLSGQGIGGIYLRAFPPNKEFYEEYIQLKFSETLVSGETYFFSFYAQLAYFNVISTHKIGLKFTPDSIIYNNFLWEIFMPDWQNNKPITDTSKWYKLEGYYTAKGNEKWLIIGGFSDTSEYSFTIVDSSKYNPISTYMPYVLIDKCFVEKLTSLPNIFTPNNDGINDIWILKKITEGGYMVLSVEIFNRWGKLVFKAGQEFTGWDGNCNGQPCSEGTYFATVLIENKSNNSIKKLSGNITLLR